MENTFIVELMGYIAAILGSIIMLPQVIKTAKTKRAADVSYWMLVVYLIATTLWIIYGFIIRALPVAFGSIIAFVLIVVQIALKARYGKQ